MPTIRQLRMLISLADTGRYTESARLLGVAQSAVTAQVKALETRLGLPLVDRGRHGARLTPAGEDGVARARRVMQELDELERVARGGAAQLGGLIRLGCLPTVGPYLLPYATPQLHAAYPDLRLFVREGSTTSLETELQDGSLDTILSTQPETESLDSVALFTEEILVGLAVDHPLAARDSIAPSDMNGENLLTLGEGHHLGKLTGRIAAQSGARLRTDYVGQSLDAVRHMVAMGAGISLIPRLYAISEIEGREDVVVRRLDHARATRIIYLCWNRSSSRADDFTRLAEILSTAASRLIGTRQTARAGH